MKTTHRLSSRHNVRHFVKIMKLCNYILLNAPPCFHPYLKDEDVLYCSVILLNSLGLTLNKLDNN